MPNTNTKLSVSWLSYPKLIVNEGRQKSNMNNVFRLMRAGGWTSPSTRMTRQIRFSWTLMESNDPPTDD